MALRGIRGSIFIVVLFTLQVFASGRISDIRIRGSEVVMDIETTPGVYYQMQCSSNLVAGTWEDVGTMFAAVSNTTTKAFSQDVSVCYLRVIEMDATAPATEPPPPPPPPPPAP